MTVEARPDHVSSLLARMGDDQRARFLKMHGPHVEHQIGLNIARSLMTWCGVDDVGVVTLGGVYSIEPVGTGFVWQFITPAVRLHKRAYIEQGRRSVRSALKLFTRIVSPIEAEYHAAVRHARRLGMTVDHVKTIAGVPVCFCVKARL